MRYVLGSRASIGGVLGSGRGGAAAAWYLAGGVAAANCVAAYQPKRAASLAASYVNLANPGTNNAAPGVAPTFDTATGWTFNGSSQYLSTGITPANNNYTMIIRFSDVTNNGWIARAADGAGAAGFGLAPARNAGGVYYQNGNGTIGQGIALVAPQMTTGIMAVAGSDGYRNGTDEANITTASFGTVTEIIIGAAQSYGGSVAAFCAVKVQAVAIYNVTLTAPQIAAISAAMAAL